jgi:RsiW-degrading membrane proteinase PrsW (M82 family)
VRATPPPPDGEPESPPPPKELSPSEFHLPETNFFRGIRMQLSGLEHPPAFKSELEPVLAVLVALVLGAFLGFVVSLAVNRAIAGGLGDARWLSPVFLSPVLEEGVKALCIFAVAIALPRVFPNRRYGVLMGAVTGLGFGVLATTVGMMGGEIQGFNSFAKLVWTPLTQPLFSAFMGMGIFVFVNRKASESSGSSLLFGLPALFTLFAIVSHMLANTIDFVAPGGVGALVAALTVCPLFIFLLRDFLCGHLNLFHFLESVEEPPDLDLSPPPPEEPSP